MGHRLGHPMRGCYCPRHNNERAYMRGYRRGHRRPRAVSLVKKIPKSQTTRQVLGWHDQCNCNESKCPRVRVEQAIAFGLSASQVMRRCACDYATYMAVRTRLDRLEDVAA